MTVAATEEFEITGDGSAPAWERAQWVPLHRRGEGGLEYETRVKLLYSGTGLYVLMDGSDARITATMTEDFLDLWNEDVFEVFLWTDEDYPVYFEYEISPLGYELPILVPNFDGEFLGWRPWHYDGERRTRRATAALGGPRESGATITGWRAEVFIPWTLLEPLQGVPPQPGALWRANFYRVDHDGETPTAWYWARVETTFHEFHRFGILRFGE
ncbi:MAG: carbohydrate-binding family 9-like protein [Gemmatimonadales bacterium]